MSQDECVRCSIEIQQPAYNMDSCRIKRLSQAKKQKEREKRELEQMNRKHLANMRVVQKNLVYVVGLDPKLAKEEVSTFLLQAPHTSAHSMSPAHPNTAIQRVFRPVWAHFQDTHFKEDNSLEARHGNTRIGHWCLCDLCTQRRRSKGHCRH